MGGMAWLTANWPWLVLFLALWQVNGQLSRILRRLDDVDRRLSGEPPPETKASTEA